MNQEELEQHLQETYEQYLYELEKLRYQQKVVKEFEENLKDLNTALRVVKLLKANAPGPHHKD